MSTLAIEILLVDNNPGDVRLTLELFREVKLSNSVHVVEDGVQALQYLNHQGEYAEAKQPDLIFLEPILPRKDGYELMREMKQSPELRHIPVIIFLGSESEWAFAQHMSQDFHSYVTKPLTMSSLISVIKSLRHLWLAISR
jgi:chemotaxis family two-component system response regulator Rcp1